MPGPSEARSAVTSSLFIRGTFLVILLIAVLGALLVYPFPVALILPCLVVRAALPLAIGLFVASRRQQRWVLLAKQARPDAAIVRTDWNAVFMSPFVNDPALTQGADDRGFVVVIAAAKDGLTFWRAAGKELIELGVLTWPEVTGVRIGEVKPVIGRKASTLQIGFEGDSALTSPIELIVRGETTSHAMNRILAGNENRHAS